MVGFTIESPNYQKLRSLKKKMQSLQDECDVGLWKRLKWKRCVDEQDVDVNELGELILQFSETVNDVISVLNEPMDIEDSSVAALALGRWEIGQWQRWRRKEEEEEVRQVLKASLTRRIRIPKFDDEDEDDDSERKKLQIKIRKAVYKEVIKEPNGKLSVSHLILEPRGQAGLPIQVKKD